MLVLYDKGPGRPKDAAIDPITDDERRKIKEIESDRTLHVDRFPSWREPSLVLDDFLFLGRRLQATDQNLLERLQIKHIINVCDLPTEQQILNHFNVTEIPMLDDPETNIKQHFDRTNQLLRGFYENNERCLVHCAAGVSRSATIVLAYLMKYHDYTLREAHSYLLGKRPQIAPNEGFLVQLIRYDNDLIESREMKKIHQ